MGACPDCGFKNAPGRASCLKCGSVFRAVKAGGSPAGIIVGLLALIAVAGGAWFFLGQSSEPPRRPTAAAVVAPAPTPPAPKAPEAALPPPEAETESPTEKRGKDLLKQGDAAFAKEDYPAASAAYLEAKMLRVTTDESLRKLEVSKSIADIIETRDYFARGVEPEPAWITAGKWKLERIDAAKLPSDAWRAEHQRLLLVLAKAAGDKPNRRSP